MSVKTHSVPHLSPPPYDRSLHPSAYERTRNSMQQQNDYTQTTATAIAQVQAEDYKGRVFKPRMNMFTTPDRLTTIALLELPGLTKSDIHVTLRDTYLLIHGTRRPPPATQYGQSMVSELKFGKFLRVLTLPVGTQADSIRASMDDGMLTVSWPAPTQPTQSSNPADPERQNISVA